MVNMTSLLDSLAEDEELSAALPSTQQVPGMSVPDAIAALRLAVASSVEAEAHRAGVLAAACCCRLSVLAHRPGVDREAAEGGAIAAIVDAMRAHFSLPIMQAAGAEALALLCIEEESELAGGDEHHPRALLRQTDALALCVSGMLAYGAEHPEVLQRGAMALSIIIGRDATLRDQALQLGAPQEWILLS
eukprot:5937222-Prymnesium_polylepis.1